MKHPPPSIPAITADTSTDNPAQNAATASTALDPGAMHEKLADAGTPGFQAEFDPAEADAAGAFQEDALSEADALASTHDAMQLPGIATKAVMPS